MDNDGGIVIAEGLARDKNSKDLSKINMEAYANLVSQNWVSIALFYDLGENAWKEEY